MKYPEGITENSSGQMPALRSAFDEGGRNERRPEYRRRSKFPLSRSERAGPLRFPPSADYPPLPNSARVGPSVPPPQIGYGEANIVQSTCLVAPHPRTPAASPGMSWHPVGTPGSRRECIPKTLTRSPPAFSAPAGSESTPKPQIRPPAASSGLTAPTRAGDTRRDSKILLSLPDTILPSLRLGPPASDSSRWPSQKPSGLM